MAARGALPTETHNRTLNIERLNYIKEYLIKIFENPRGQEGIWTKYLSRSYGRSFFMEKLVEDYTSQVNSNDLSKLISKMDLLQTSFQAIQNRGPYKPKVNPHRVRHHAKPYDHPPNLRKPNGRKNSLG